MSMRYLLTAPLVLLAAALCSGQEPAPKSVDQWVSEITSLRAQRAALDKQEAAALAGLKAELKRQADLLDKLGGTDVKPPVPVPPTPPVDPLRAKLKAAYDAAPGTAAEKSEWAKDLAALYRQAAKLVADPEVGTAAELLRRLKAAATSLLGPMALVDVRRAVKEWLAAVLPTTTDAELTESHRKGAADLFAKLAMHLEEIAK